jgi:hypothetical protein
MSAATWKINPSRPSPGWLVLIGPYDAEFVVALKAAIPARDREWNEILKGWKFKESYRAVVEALIEKHS